MTFNSISWSILAGIPVYAYFTWLCKECAAPRDSRRQFRNSIGIMGISLALAVFLVIPWAAYQGWSWDDVLMADVPFRKMRTAIYAIYALASAGALGVIHAAAVGLAGKVQRLGS